MYRNSKVNMSCISEKDCRKTWIRLVGNILKCLSVFSFFCLPLLFPSCSKENLCLFDTLAVTKIGFYSFKNGEFPKTAVDTFSATGISPDGLIRVIANARNLNSASLPLSNISDTTDYIFSFNSMQMIIDTVPDTSYTSITVQDTLRFVYSRELLLISPLRGSGYNYMPEKVISTNNLVDSARIVPQVLKMIIDNVPDTSYTFIPVQDTLRFVYSRELLLISPLCGFGYNYILEKVISTNNMIDSARIVVPEVFIKSQENADNVQIYF